MKKLIFFLIVFLTTFTSKAQVNENNALAYIKEYYSDFKTGYDSPDGYVTLTDNYKVKLLNSIFTLTYDTYDKKVIVKKDNIAFDLKKIIRIYPNGTDILENYGSKDDDYQMIIVPINGKLAFKTKTDEYNLNIYYEVDNDVEQSEIYKVFEVLINSYKI